MKLFILTTLPLHILLYCLFISVLSYCVSVVPTRPYVSSPQHHFNFRMLYEYLFRCNALYYRNKFSYIIRWNTLHQKMKMIFICSNLHKTYLISFLYRSTGCFQRFFNFLAKYFSSVFRRTNYMIQQKTFIMTFEYMFTHIINLHILPRPRGSGNSLD